MEPRCIELIFSIKLSYMGVLGLQLIVLVEFGVVNYQFASCALVYLAIRIENNGNFISAANCHNDPPAVFSSTLEFPIISQL